MPLRIEDYALIGDTQTAALVGRDGSIDWACFPRFDSEACFAALLGDREHGRWSIAPVAPVVRSARVYRPGTLVLETELETAGGTVRIVDFMPIRGHTPDIVRIVEGVRGEVDMRLDLVIRFDYGKVIPWARRVDDALVAIAGPDALCFRGDVEVHGEDMATVAEFRIRGGERRSFVCTWYPSHEPVPSPIDPIREREQTEGRWRAWSSRCRYRGPWREAVSTSLMVLKALSYGPTGGIVAAPTTSLPEWPGGPRNWDYRYCWLRDATMTLYALLLAGYADEAIAWREWLLRAVAGDHDRLQIMYGIGGERELHERHLPWLPGYEGSRPVRIGNAAHEQLQLDVYGEMADVLYEARRFGIPPDPWVWGLEKALLGSLEQRWREPDLGIWEVRGQPRHFTHSKVMAWVAFDRAVKAVERFGRDGPPDGIERWRATRDEIHAEVMLRGFDPVRNTFTQSYGRPELDASLLMIPIVGFLSCHDERVHGTVRAIERELLDDGLVLRYRTHDSGVIDGLPAGEGTFLPCSFWLADNYMQMGRRDEAVALFERLVSLGNDVGLFSEEYDPSSGRMLGNFPQAFTHLALVNTAFNLTTALEGPAPAQHRSESPG